MENITNAQITELLEKVRTLKEKSDSKPEVILEKYNFFRFLGFGHDELVFSRMIAHLLNRKASHECGTLFLESFFELLRKEIPFIPNSLKLSKSIIDVEKFIGDKNDKEGGRIDIFLRIPDENNQVWAFVIENKVYAKDQKYQLRRYKNFVDKAYPKRNFVIYLNLFETPPSESSTEISISKLEENPQIKYWEQISYDFFIRQWLEACLEKNRNNNQIIKPAIDQILNQFLSQINRLTGHEFKKEEERKMHVLLENQDNLKTARLLVKEYNSLRTNKLKEMSKEICNYVKSSFPSELENTGVKKDPGEDGHVLSFCKNNKWKHLRIDICFGHKDYDFKINITFRSELKSEIIIKEKIRAIFQEKYLPDFNYDSEFSACRKVYKYFEDWIDKTEEIKNVFNNVVEICDSFESNELLEASY